MQEVPDRSPSHDATKAVDQALRRLRSAALATVLAGALFSAVAVLYQTGSSGNITADVAGSVNLVLLFLSPYAALALLVATLVRRRPTAVVVLAGAVTTTLWGVYWHLDILVLRPSAVAQVLSPVLITGNQWLIVLTTGAVSLATLLFERWSRRRTGGR